MKATNAATAIAWAGAGAALAFAAWTHNEAPAPADTALEEARTSAKTMHTLALAWSADAARVANDREASFDSLAAYVPKARALAADLDTALAKVQELPERLGADARAYTAAMQGLRERIERFKTGYAVIRNSERYLPLAAAEVAQAAKEAGNETIAQTAATIAKTLEKHGNENAALRAVTEMKAHATAGGGALAQSAARMEAHVKVLTARRGRVVRLLTEIGADPLEGRYETLARAIASERDTRALERDRIARTARTAEHASIGLGALGALTLLAGAIGARKGKSAAPEADQQRLTPIIEWPLEEPSALTGAGGSEREADAAQTHGQAVASALLSIGAAEGATGAVLGRYIERMKDDALAIGSGAAPTHARRLAADLQRIGYLTNAMRQLARRCDAAPSTSVDARNTVERAIGRSPSDIRILRAVNGRPKALARAHTLDIVLDAMLEAATGAAALRVTGGQVQIRVGSSPNEVRIEMRDNGPGLDAEHQNARFIPFHDTRAESYGIELAAARHAARMMGGDMWSTAEAGTCSTLHLSLPAYE